MVLECHVKMSSELEFIAVNLHVVFGVREVKTCSAPHPTLTFTVPISCLFSDILQLV